MPETEQRNIHPAALPDFHTSSGDNVLFCPLPSVRVRSLGFPEMGGCYLLKNNGGNSGINISVLYWRCSLECPLLEVPLYNIAFGVVEVQVTCVCGWDISSS
jgi:hypothetical protein